MSMFGQVYVKDNKYRLKGDFHHIEPNMPIRNADDNWRLVGVTNHRSLTYIHSYGGEAIFFESLSKGKLLASQCINPKCPANGTIYEPFRTHCMDCLKKNKVIDITDLARRTATIHTFTVCERSGAFSLLEKPIKFINVELKGVSTILMSYLSVGEPKIGLRVVPIFKKLDPTYTILDLSWVPKGTHKSLLPKGFSF